MKPQVIYEDNHLIAVNKRGGELSQKDKTNDDSLIENVKAYIKVKYEKPGDVFLGSIHRLDRPTSGVIVYARTSKALARMNDIFKNKTLTKKYLALVDRRPGDVEGVMEDYLLKDQRKNRSSVTKSSKNGAKLAQLEYKLIGEFNKYYLLEINLLTGRHHQIRAQLSSRGLRIVGDLKYGFPEANKDKSICLHCSELSFIHPVKKEPLRLTAKLPSVPEWRGVGKY